MKQLFIIHHWCIVDAKYADLARVLFSLELCYFFRSLLFRSSDFKSVEIERFQETKVGNEFDGVVTHFFNELSFCGPV